MFADVSVAAALFEHMGDTEAMHAVDRCLKRMSRSIDGYAGRQFRLSGMKCWLFLKTPGEACQASIDMQSKSCFARRFWL